MVTLMILQCTAGRWALRGMWRFSSCDPSTRHAPPTTPSHRSRTRGRPGHTRTSSRPLRVCGSTGQLRTSRAVTSVQLRPPTEDRGSGLPCTSAYSVRSLSVALW